MLNLSRDIRIIYSLKMAACSATEASRYFMCVIGSANSGKTQFMQTIAKTNSADRLNVVFCKEHIQHEWYINDSVNIFTDLAYIVHLNFDRPMNIFIDDLSEELSQLMHEDKDLYGKWLGLFMNYRVRDVNIVASFYDTKLINNTMMKNATHYAFTRPEYDFEIIQYRLGGYSNLYYMHEEAYKVFKKNKQKNYLFVVALRDRSSCVIKAII